MSTLQIKKKSKTYKNIKTKLLNLLLAVLLSAYNSDSTDTPVSKEPINIVVKMEPITSNMTDVSGIYTLQANKKYSVREDGEYKILLAKNTYKDREGKEKGILSYGIFDVAEKECIYYTEGIDVTKRLERDWEFYDDTNNPTNTNKQLICTSRPKEEQIENKKRDY